MRRIMMVVLLSVTFLAATATVSVAASNYQESIPCYIGCSDVG